MSPFSRAKALLLICADQCCFSNLVRLSEQGKTTFPTNRTVRWGEFAFSPHITRSLLPGPSTHDREILKCLRLFIRVKRTLRKTDGTGAEGGSGGDQSGRVSASLARVHDDATAGRGYIVGRRDVCYGRGVSQSRTKPTTVHLRHKSFLFRLLETCINVPASHSWETCIHQIRLHFE